MTPFKFLAFLHQHTEGDVELRRFHNTDREVSSRSIWTRDLKRVVGRKVQNSPITQMVSTALFLRLPPAMSRNLRPVPFG